MSDEQPHSYTLLQPPRLSYGPGCANACVDDIVARGLRQILLITTPPMAPHAKPLVEGLAGHNILVSVIADILLEPDVNGLERILSEARRLTPDGIIGFGGGSVLDLAKLAAALHDRPEPVDTFFGTGFVPGRSTYLACVPTTAGTGSEVGPHAFLSGNKGEPAKQVISSHWLVPDAAYVDPLLTVSVPPAQTAATGLTALAHCLDASVDLRAHDMSDALAYEGARLIATQLPAAMKNGLDVQARAAIALGSVYGGLCVGSIGHGTTHVMASAVAAQFKISHSQACAQMIAPVMRYNLAAASKQYAAISHALGMTGQSDAEAAEKLVVYVEKICADGGIPRGLMSVGIPEKAVPQLAAAACENFRHLRHNPRAITPMDAEVIYGDACAG